MTYGIIENNKLINVYYYIEDPSILSGFNTVVLPDDFEIGKQDYVNGAIVPNADYISIASKLDKESSVSKLTVTTTSGKIFDGDEKSQDRLLRAVNIANITGELTTIWKLANNEIVVVTLDEIKEALTLASREMSRIWLN